jgi:hypothetical protein
MKLLTPGLVFFGNCRSCLGAAENSLPKQQKENPEHPFQSGASV